MHSLCHLKNQLKQCLTQIVVKWSAQAASIAFSGMETWLRGLGLPPHHARVGQVAEERVGVGAALGLRLQRRSELRADPSTTHEDVGAAIDPREREAGLRRLEQAVAPEGRHLEAGGRGQ